MAFGDDLRTDQANLEDAADLLEKLLTTAPTPDSQETVQSFSSATPATVSGCTEDVTVEAGDVVHVLATGRYSTNATNTTGDLQLQEDGTLIGIKQDCYDDSTVTNGNACGFTLYHQKTISTPGTYTYDLKASRTAGSNTFYVDEVVFAVWTSRAS